MTFQDSEGETIPDYPIQDHIGRGLRSLADRRGHGSPDLGLYSGLNEMCHFELEPMAAETS